MNIHENKMSVSEFNATKRSIKEMEKPAPISELAKKVLIKGENRREFEELRLALLEELVPHTKIENILCEKFIVAAWKLSRARVIEKTLLNHQNAITEMENLGVFEDTPGRKRIRNIKKVDLTNDAAQLLINYQIELEKSMREALKDLREEQAKRQAQGPLPPKSQVL